MFIHAHISITEPFPFSPAIFFTLQKHYGRWGTPDICPTCLNFLIQHFPPSFSPFSFQTPHNPNTITSSLKNKNISRALSSLNYFKVCISASKISSFIYLKLLHEQALKQEKDTSWRQSATCFHHLELAVGHKVSYQAWVLKKIKTTKTLFYFAIVSTTYTETFVGGKHSPAIS